MDVKLGGSLTGCRLELVRWPCHQCPLCMGFSHSPRRLQTAYMGATYENVHHVAKYKATFQCMSMLQDAQRHAAETALQDLRQQAQSNLDNANAAKAQLQSELITAQQKMSSLQKERAEVTCCCSY